MNYLAAELSRYLKKMFFYRCKQRSITLIYPDTRRYRDYDPAFSRLMRLLRLVRWTNKFQCTAFLKFEFHE